MRTLVVLSAGLLLALPQGLVAGGCYRSRAVYSTYAVPAITYAAPAKVAYYPKVVEVPKSPDYYFSTNEYFRDKLLVDAIAGRMEATFNQRQEVQELRQEIQLLRRQMFNLQPNGTPPPMAPAPRDDHPPAPPARQPAPKSTGAIPAGLQQVVQASCIRCHGATNEKAGGGFDLRDLGAVSADKRLLAYALVNSGEMPTGGKPISDADTLLFYTWATGRTAQAQAPK